VSISLAHPAHGEEITGLSHLKPLRDYGVGRPCLGGCGHRVNRYASDQMCFRCRHREAARLVDIQTRCARVLLHAEQHEIKDVLGLDSAEASHIRTFSVNPTHEQMQRLIDWHETQRGRND
jgi:hypothetical protein